MAQRINQEFNVSFEYPVVFTRNAFDAGNTSLCDLIQRQNDRDIHRVIVFADANLCSTQPQLLEQLSSYFETHRDSLDLVCAPKIVLGGEAIKNDYRLIMEMVDTMLEYRICRHSIVLILGGGAVLDAVGFAASIVHRGLRVVRMPSTVLAQNDAGIGVKNGMNLHGGKNTIGCFAPPFAVLNDYALLNSLDDEHWIAGISEAFKVAMIKDADFFAQLCEQSSAYATRDPKAMEKLVERCAALHLEHIANSGDAFELGSARPLDYGHWIAHKLENLSNYSISHGHAVATGIAIDTCYAGISGWLSEEEVHRTLSALKTCGFQLWYTLLEGDAIYNGLEDFREHLGGELCITFPDGIGQRREENLVDLEIYKQAFAHVQHFCATATS